MKKLVVSLFAFAFLFVGYNSSAYAAKSANDTKNCSDFNSQKEAQNFWNQQGYGVENDPHQLDKDNDGIPCEDTKYPVDTNATTQEKNKTDTQTTTTDNTNKQQGTKLPNTASNNVTMMFVSAGGILAGSLIVFRRKKINS
ncbi:excalibur calcium-binding domain-containing protein [Bacillus pseudomycoides]|uniref:Excalibur calcium-binding domain-containing protein n=1 Tax=Bacillus bingmayongensis TaxID=1150157 RepID=A0ABU5JTH2_9BACI|nr:excalibur calcium-binding domain-containing protein [Bacillus pseudomycoides]